ncbi:MAG TPA: hypothetical protein PKE29_05740 [Phycisphaerales bacterium]|nr:hypothetical protein [Phycisphaerales bacterium]
MQAFGRILLLIVLLFLFPSSASAQTPTPEATLSAFTTLQRHIRSWSPASADEHLPAALGACLTLQLRGQVIARAVAWSPDPFAENAASPEVLRRVLAQAIEQAEPKLGVPNDALRDEAIKQTAQEITLSLELAGPLSAIEPNTWDDAEMLLRPGLDGVAVKANRGPGASPGTATITLQSIFPSHMLLTSTLPHRALGSAIAQTIGEGGGAAALEDPKKVRDRHHLRFYTFRTTHAAQATPKSAAGLLYRGERLIPANQQPSSKELREFARKLADHLVARLLPADAKGERHMLANLRPGAETDATPAPALDQLVAAYAVEQYRELLGQGGLRADAFGNPRWLFVRAAAYAGTSGVSAAPAMYLLLAPSISDPRKERDILEVRACAALRFTMFGEALRDWADDPESQSLVAALNPSVVPGPLKPMLVMAALGMPREIGSPELSKTESMLRSIYSETPEGRLVILMPWLGWADLAQSRSVAQEARVQAVAPPGLPTALALRRMRDQVWQHQLTPLTATEDTQDMIGGIVFTSGLAEGGSGGSRGSGGGGNPYPTWQCVRPLAFIATMLGDPRLTTAEERPREIANLLLAMRYLRQLQVDDASAWMYPNPEQATGGIRAAVWDNSLPTDATSLTLLCVTELLKSLDKLAAEKTPPSPSVPPE